MEARAVLQVREARCCKVEDRFRIVEAHAVLVFLPSSDTEMHINLDKRPDYFFLKGIFQGCQRGARGVHEHFFVWHAHEPRMCNTPPPGLNLYYAPEFITCLTLNFHGLN